jgi:methylated-DNA-[protein]-cysteine S-methyltransferase
MSTLSATHMTSPIGMLTIVASDDAVVAIRWDTESDDREPSAHNPVDRKLERHGDLAIVRSDDHPVLAAAVAQLEEYFDGVRTDFELPLDPEGTAFQRQAWHELQRIPFGETITYGEQAIRLGDRKKMRAVGSANGKNPIPIVVPCHRVVGADGKLTGFAGGLDAKAWLLDHEFQVRAAAR